MPGARAATDAEADSVPDRGCARPRGAAAGRGGEPEQGPARTSADELKRALARIGLLVIYPIRMVERFTLPRERGRPQARLSIYCSRGHPHAHDTRPPQAGSGPPPEAHGRPA